MFRIYVIKKGYSDMNTIMPPKTCYFISTIIPNYHKVFCF